MKVWTALSALSLVGVTTLVTSAAFGTFDTGPFLDPNDLAVLTPVPTDLEVTQAGVKVALVEVEYSSTATRITLELTSPIAQTSKRGNLFEAFDLGQLTVEGLRSSEIRESYWKSGENGVERRHLVLAPMIGPDKEVLIQVNSLCLVPPDGGPCEERAGPWAFRLLPGSEALDPLSERIGVNETLTRSGISVTIHDVALSSSEVLVSYTISADVPIRAAGAHLELVYDDGSIVVGRERHLADDRSEVSFPPLKRGTKSFTLRSQALVRMTAESPVQDQSEMVLDLASALAGKDINGPVEKVAVGMKRDVNGDQFTVRDAEIGSGSLRLTIENTTTRGDGGMVFAAGSDVYLVDDDGISHPVQSLIIGFSKDDQGTIGLGTELIGFAAVDLLKLSNARLTSKAVATLVPGPWEFSISVP